MVLSGFPFGNPKLYPHPLRLRCDFQKAGKIGQLFNLRGHHGILGNEVLTCGLGLTQNTAHPGGATVGHTLSDDFTLADEAGREIGRSAPLAGGAAQNQSTAPVRTKKSGPTNIG